jgi:transcriptional regulator with XRE-family HTH domain
VYCVPRLQSWCGTTVPGAAPPRQVPDQGIPGTPPTISMLWCMSGTSPKAVALGAELRTARERAQIGLRELAKKLGIDHSTLSRAESGTRPPTTELTSRILALVGVTGDEFERIVAMSRDTDGPAWLAVTLPDLQSQLSALLSFEQMATDITSMSPLLIPGLLQTGGYVRAIMRSAGVPRGDVDIRVATRLGRQEILTRPHHPVRLTAFIGASALRNPIGGAEVMRDQLDHLLKVADWPNVTLRAIPDDVGWHPALEGAFVLIDAPAMSAVHIENRQSGLFLKEEPDVAVYKEAVEKMLSVAMSPVHTTELIAREAEKIRGSNE